MSNFSARHPTFSSALAFLRERLAPGPSGTPPNLDNLADVLAAWQSLTNCPGGLDACWFSILFILKGLSDFRIGLRERDFSYFGIERWTGGADPICLPFRGEIPFIYLINKKAISAVGAPPEFLGLVDFVAKTTGSGLAIALTDPPATQESTDLRTGMRVRYEFTRLPPLEASLGEYAKTPFYWVQRAESGRSRSYAVTIQGVGH